MANATTSTAADISAPAPVTSKTLFIEAGEESAFLARECVFNIEPLADMLIRLADEQRAANSLQDAPPPAVLRMLGCRIKELNSLLMSYLCDDGITLEEARSMFFHDAITFDDEVSHG